ncbi:MAG: hypothetical protein V7637_5289 [Mycobacteriales bacterium]
MTGGRPRRDWSVVVDRALVGVTGAAVTVQGAAALQPADFGRLSAVLVGYYFVLTALRAMVPGVYLARFAGWPGPPVGAARWAQITSLRLALLVSAATGLLAAAGPALSVSGRQLLGAAAVALPLLVWQEARRAVLLAAARPGLAAASGALVLAGQVTGGIAVRLAGRVSGPALLLCWAAGAAVAIGCVPVPDRRRLPGRAGAWRWLVEGRPHWLRSCCADMALGGTGPAAVLLAAMAAGTLVAAGIRTALLLLAPLVPALRAAAHVAAAEAARARPARHRRFVAVCQAGTVVAGAAWLAALAMLPRPALTPLVGANLAAGLAALPGMALFVVGSLLLAAPVAALCGSGHVQSGTALAVTLMPALLAAPVLIAVRGAGAAEVATAFGVFGVLSALAWTALSATVQRPPPPGPGRTPQLGPGRTLQPNPGRTPQPGPGRTLQPSSGRKPQPGPGLSRPWCDPTSGCCGRTAGRPAG